MSAPLKIIYAGTPEFAATALQALIGSHHRVVAVYTQPDRPAGRGRKLSASPVKQLALEHAIPVFQPERLRDESEWERLRALDADVMVVAAYGLILPREVLSIPRYGCLNIHASLLPRWRGAAPIQRAILAGDRVSGVTIMQMDVGLDTGDMLEKRETPIHGDDTGGSLHDRLAGIGAEAILSVLDKVGKGTLTPQAQNNDEANYAAKLSKAEAEIDWRQPSGEIERLVRAFNPWPVAHTPYEKGALRIWLARAIEGDGRAEPGRVIATGKGGIDVACGEGILRIEQLQPPGKRPMSAADFLNANTLEGAVLGG